ncbi:MAG: response regulator transcription factor [Bacteroidota bacterium]|nr:response regulator transcription factor [Bacteroidota bacterium]
MTILVAEDEIIMLKTIELRLKKDGHQVITTRDGREALKQIDESFPDLIITDIMMPFASGLEIIEAVKKKPGKKIPVIVLSAMGQENVVLEAFQLGADDYITKPFSPNELSMRVRRYIPETLNESHNQVILI